MISYLEGRIKIIREKYLILMVGGIGYKIFAPAILLEGLKDNEEIAIYTHDYVREDSRDLYGFRSPAELEMFELLLSISGIGPKSALGIMGVATLADLMETIVSGDPVLLTKVSGVGEKTAARVILELKDKIRSVAKDGSGLGALGGSSDEIDALLALGYTPNQAREALRRVDPSLVDSGQRIKEALKNLGK
jgi:holliday junction DNA helicase RuvA